ncbi:60S ribosomal export protein NMD3 [Archaeoglobus profundus]|uniref:NMD3 family protein n=1 Tax=Archaeoglobus profundus (strain DSM 5631 / JCM 9629 / NBRC 100127 / Av18) TaxID=572546 RepID=D2RHI5_ARCPA|nr:NMD3-related protein [Archaeoglobus profundus]ADB57760.1 NMD3 family protein [Archaeoglobus profundus DSM 5631]
MRCAICGNTAVIDGMCIDCYMKRNKLSWVDDIIEVVRCPKCGYFKVGRRWENLDFESALLELIHSSVRIHPQFDVEHLEVEPLTTGEVGKYIIRLVGNVEGYDVVDESIVEVRLKSRTCERCTRLSGGYYEAIVQIRADDREIERDELETVKDIINRVLERESDNQKAFVSKIVERKEGIDFYFGDKNIGRKVSREIVKALGGRLIESRKLHTRIDGRDVYRYTFAVRLPCYRIGDIVLDNGRICIVTGKDKGIDIDNLSSVNLKEPKVVRRREELEKGVVVNYDEYIVEIANESGVLQAVKTGNVEIGEEVYFFEHDSRFYAIPKEMYEGG